LAILGAARQHEKIGGARRRIVTIAIEHKAVLGPCRRLAENGWDIITLPVDHQGTVDLHAAEEAITDDTLLVSIQAANHEIGTIQPVRAVAQLAHERGALVHCDAAQAVGKIPFDLNEWDVDLLSLSGHKLYGPKGIGALWLRGGPRCLPLEPLATGGGQESSLRPGTLNVPAIVGLGTACALCAELMTKESQRIGALRDMLEKTFGDAISNLRCNGNPHNRLPGSSNLTFPGIEAEALLANLSDIAVSTGSACESGAIEPSRTLMSIGLSSEEAFSTLRFGLGRFTTTDEIETAIAQVTQAYHDYVKIQRPL
jgi:cysteine desulfurase